MALTVSIVGPDRTFWSGEASTVSVPAADGELGILAGRQPVLTVLTPGTVRITETGGPGAEVEILGGFASVDDDVVMIVVDEHDERRAAHAAGSD